jgi:hypothetical protein
MFRTQVARRNLTPFALWVRKSKGQFLELRPSKRTAAAAETYRALSPIDMAALVAEAAATPAKESATPPRKHEFREFVKENFESVKHLGRKERFTAISAKWAEQKESMTAEETPQHDADLPYRKFVKANYDSVRHLPPAKRLKAIADKWIEHKRLRG